MIGVAFKGIILKLLSIENRFLCLIMCNFSYHSLSCIQLLYWCAFVATNKQYLLLRCHKLLCGTAWRFVWCVRQRLAWMFTSLHSSRLISSYVVLCSPYFIFSINWVGRQQKRSFTVGCSVRDAYAESHWSESLPTYTIHSSRLISICVCGMFEQKQNIVLYPPNYIQL